MSDPNMESDLDAAGKLFASESSVYETGGVESDDKRLAFVAWPIEYTIVLKDERVINSKGTVTFLFVREDGEYKIRQLNWSSRRKSTAR